MSDKNFRVRHGLEVVGDATLTGNLQVSGNQIKSSSGSTAITLNGTDVTLAGNLTINGSTTTIESTTLVVDDPNIVLGKDNTTNAQADGGGITVKGATDKTFTYDNAVARWTTNIGLEVGGRLSTDATYGLVVSENQFETGTVNAFTVGGTTGDASLYGDMYLGGGATGQSDLVLNSRTTASASQNATISVERGTDPNARIRWNESTDKWQQTRDNSTYYDIPISTAELAEVTNLYYLDSRARAALSGGTGVTYSTVTGQISIGQAVGTTDNVTFGDVAVNGGDITTTQTTASVFNTTATTLNIGGAATTTTLNSAATASSLVIGANRLTSPAIFNFAGANNYRGLLINNATSGAYAAARSGLVIRTVPTTAIGPRGGIVFENARSNASGVAAAIQGPSTSQAGDFLGEIIAGGYATDRYVTEAVGAAPLGFTSYATETWVNSGTTVSNCGTGWALQLQPTATNLAATSRVTTIDSSPQNLTLRSDSQGFSKGKTSQFVATGCSTSGTTLTIGTLTSGSIVVGTMIQNSTNLLPAGTYIVANISGSGSGSTWTLNQTPGTLASLTLAGQQGYMAMTGAGNVDVMGNLTVRAQPTSTTRPINYARVYGQWQYDATVTPVAANTAYAYPIAGVSGVVDMANIATVGSTSRIIPGALGQYKLQFSVQIDNADPGSDHTAHFWWRKNGTDVPNSMGRIHVAKQQETIGGWDNMIDVTTITDYWELMYAVDDTNITLPYYAATAFGPGTASMFITLVPVGA